MASPSHAEQTIVKQPSNRVTEETMGQKPREVTILAQTQESPRLFRR